jgi:hypothetical protein
MVRADKSDAYRDKSRHERDVHGGSRTRVAKP